MPPVALGRYYTSKTFEMKSRTAKEGYLCKMTSESGQRLKRQSQSDQTIEEVCYSDSLSTLRVHLDQNLLIQLIICNTSLCKSINDLKIGARGVAS